MAINPENAHNVQVQNIENKDSGVRKILARQAKRDKTQGIIDSITIASTEHVSWMLQLPTVTTTKDFVSIPTVSLENRGGVILKRKNTCSRTNTPGVAKEGPCEIREHHLRLPCDRRFTRSQEVVIESVNKTPFSTESKFLYILQNCFL